MTSRSSIRTTVPFVIGLAVLAIFACGGPRKLDQMSAHELLDYGKEKYEKSKYLRATELFQALVYNFPGEALVDTAQYYLGLSHFGNKDFELAGIEFNRLILNYPSSEFFENAIFLKAVCFYKSTPTHFGLDQTSLKEAIKQFEDFLVDFPESDVIPDVQEFLLVTRSRMAHKIYESGMVYSHLRAWEAAKTYFQKVIDGYTETDWGAHALYRYAEMEYNLGRYDEAGSRLESFLALFPEHGLIEKVRKLIIKSAFTAGRADFESGSYDSARDRLNSFREAFPEHKMAKKAEKYLRQIDEIQGKETNSESASSG